MSLDPLAQINLVTLGAVALIFVVTLLVLRRVCFLPLIAVMERRTAKIESANALKSQAELVLADARRDADARLSTARAEAERIVEEVRQEIAARRDKALARANEEAAALLARGREEALAFKRSEEVRLHAELQSCVQQTLSRMLGTVDEGAVRLLVRQALESARTG